MGGIGGVGGGGVSLTQLEDTLKTLVSELQQETSSLPGQDQGQGQSDGSCGPQGSDDFQATLAQLAKELQNAGIGGSDPGSSSPSAAMPPNLDSPPSSGTTTPSSPSSWGSPFSGTTTPSTGTTTPGEPGQTDPMLAAYATQLVGNSNADNVNAGLANLSSLSNQVAADVATGKLSAAQGNIDESDIGKMQNYEQTVMSGNEHQSTDTMQKNEKAFAAQISDDLNPGSDPDPTKITTGNELGHY